MTSVQWAEKGRLLSVGTNQGKVKIYDAETSKMIREFGGHVGRVGALSWQFGSNANVLSSGSKDRTILNRDMRSANDFIGCLTGHK